MQRWFFADEIEPCEVVVPTPSTPSTPALSHVSSKLTFHKWTLRVRVQQKLYANEKVAVVGDNDDLGNWYYTSCKIMNQCCDEIWATTINVAREKPTSYRYLITALDLTAGLHIVRRWETHLEPRIIPANAVIPDDEVLDYFTWSHGDEKIDRGWLTTESLVQLRFFNAPFNCRPRLKDRLLYVKVTPMSVGVNSKCGHVRKVIGPQRDDADSDAGSYFMDVVSDEELPCVCPQCAAGLSTAFAFSEVTTLNDDNNLLRPQPTYGTPCGPDDMVIFHLTIGEIRSTSYLIDLYTYSSKAGADEPPYHFGYQYIMPQAFKRSEGQLTVPVRCATKHRLMGVMRVGYLIVRPMVSYFFDMKVSYERYWNPTWLGLDIGHRGAGQTTGRGAGGVAAGGSVAAGRSVAAGDSVAAGNGEGDSLNKCYIRENTIASLKHAVEHGADMVEFDVQLSRDLVPVVYHDFMINLLTQGKQSARGRKNYWPAPLFLFTMEELKKLRSSNTEAEELLRAARCFKEEDLLDHRPFPELAEVLAAIDPTVGFNIEVKWSQKHINGTMEANFTQADRNLYVDCILDVVLRHAEKRRIVFSSFDADICTVLRYKQNLYPVMFLTLGSCTKYKKYMDPRGNSTEMAIHNAIAMELLGVVIHTGDLFEHPDQIQLLNLASKYRLAVFCWGDDNNSEETINKLKNWGLHGIIYDKIDVLSNKDVQQSVYRMQAMDESQKDDLKEETEKKCPPVT